VNTVTNLQIPQRVNLLTSLVADKLSRRNLPHGVSFNFKSPLGVNFKMVPSFYIKMSDI
jgi:hypothetical protein